MNNALQQIGGCSPCACGIVEQCPGYISPYYWWTLGLAVVVLLFALLPYFRKKKITTLAKRMAIVSGIIVAVVGGYIVYQLVSGWLDDIERAQKVEVCKRRAAQSSFHYDACEY